MARHTVRKGPTGKQAGKGRRKAKPKARQTGIGQRPLTIHKLSLPTAALQALPTTQRSAILLLGLFLNEANWLRKLLVKAAISIGDDPDGQANFALTVQLATTLAAKIHEGWEKVRAGELAKEIQTVPLSDGLKALRKDINRALKTPTIRTIRNTYSFHYPGALDFAKLAAIDDTDATIYLTASAYNGDVFSHLSSLAALEPLLAVDGAADWRNALVTVWNEVTKVAGLYCLFLSEALGVLISQWLAGKFSIATVVEAQAPELHDVPLRFFAHAPSDLETLREEVAAQEKGDTSPIAGQ